jgi:hypothetical protein
LKQISRMHTLSYRTTSENGLSFEWLIDGQSLPALLGVPADERGMPYWVWLSGLPSGAQIDEPEGRVLVSACSCGEPGCGHTSCALTHEPGIVTMAHFWSDQTDITSPLTFAVSAEPFHAVVAAITESSRTYSARRVDAANQKPV